MPEISCLSDSVSVYIRLSNVTNAVGEEKEGSYHTAYLTTSAPQGAGENYILLTNNIYEYM